MDVFKLIFTIITAVLCGIGFWYFWQTKKTELLKIITILGIGLKLIATILIYSIFPQINYGSDAAVYYFPQILLLLDGKIPYLDFYSSYSILFQLLFLPAVYIWPSVGSIVLTMVIFESLMVLLYLSRGIKKNDSLVWHVAFLYTYSPISIYWITTGYNSVLIGFFTVTALILVEYRKDLFTGLSMLFGFLISKFLIVLAWPGIIFYSSEGIMKRILPLTILIIISIILIAFGIDIFSPLKYEVGRSTSGNLWFLVIAIFPTLSSTIWWNILPTVIFSVVFIPILIKYIKAVNIKNYGNFDFSAAFVSLTFLLFMIFSKKTYPFYLQMSLLLIIHTAIRSQKDLIKFMIIFVFLNSVTFIEPYLFQLSGFPQKPIFTNQHYIILLIVNLLEVLSYLQLSQICYKRLLILGLSSNVSKINQ